MYWPMDLLIALVLVAGHPDEETKALTLDSQAPALHVKAPNGKRLTQHTRFSIPATRMNGIRIDEISGLAWDEDEQVLYAVSDNGSVIHFRLKLGSDTIVAIEPVFAAHLAEAEARGSRRRKLDAEGLTLLNADNGRAGDTELVVVTEREPRFIRFSPAGAILGETSPPTPLEDRRNYRGSKALESVANHRGHGLLTAPESPLKGQPEDRHSIYASGRRWSIARQAPDSRLKALDVLPDGNQAPGDGLGAAGSLPMADRVLRGRRAVHFIRSPTAGEPIPMR